MKKKVGRRIGSALLCLALMLSGWPISAEKVHAAATQQAAGDFVVTTEDHGTYSYAEGVLTINEGAELTVENADPETATKDRIVVECSTEVSVTLAGVNICQEELLPAFELNSGDVRVILAEGTRNRLKSGGACAGLQKAEASGKLIIEGEGELYAEGVGSAAGIGGGKDGSASDITISGGTIIAIGGYNGAGIGGGKDGSASDITISGGTVIAIGGYEGAGIGGGRKGSASDITISEGTVTAIGDINAAGIGAGGGFTYTNVGSYGNGASNITISGGVVTAAGGFDGGAGIGGSKKGEATNIIITGGLIKATGGDSACDIGAGAEIAPAAPVDDNGNSLYLLVIENPSGEEIKLGGETLPYTGHTYYNKEQGKWITEDKVYVYYPRVEALPVQIGNAEPFEYVYVEGLGYVTKQNADTGDFSVSGGAFLEDYVFGNGVLRVLTDEPLTIANKEGIETTADRIEIEEGVSAKVTLAGINIEAPYGMSAFKIADNSTGDVTVTLAEGTTNTLRSGGEDSAALQKNGTEGTLEITGNGTLLAEVGENYISCDGAAGIGGGDKGDASNITISGGTITAIGCDGGSGIGSGGMGYARNITIKGGMIAAKGGGWGLGIGGDRQAIDITISGGIVTAQGKSGGAGIGSDSKAGNVTISGGVVTATGGHIDGAGIGGGGYGESSIIITGGSVKAVGGGEHGHDLGGSYDLGATIPKDEEGNTRRLFVYDNPDKEDISVDGVSLREHTYYDFSSSEWKVEDRLYLYCPDEFTMTRGASQTVHYKWFRGVGYLEISGEPKELDLTVTGGTEYTDYVYDGSQRIYVLTGTPLTIKNRDGVEKSETGIRVVKGVKADITLAGVSIDTSESSQVAAFEIEEDSDPNVTVTLAEGTTNTLKSGENCAGLQKNGYGGTLTITGNGKLIAVGGNGGAGIGGGAGKRASKIKIDEGAAITAVGGDGGAGIGGGSNGSGARITISGIKSAVKAVAGNQANSIGGGRNGDGAVLPTDDASNSLYPLVINNPDHETIKIDETEIPHKEHTDYDSASQTLKTEAKVYLYHSKTCTVSVGDKELNYQLTDGIGYKAVLTDTTNMDFEVSGGTVGTDYLYDGYNKILYVLTDKALTIKNKEGVTAADDRIQIEKGVSANVTLAGVNIDASVINEAALKIADDSSGTVTVTLADGTINTLTGGTFHAGLQKNGTVGSLIIKGGGTLYANGGTYGAGIGGGNQDNSVNITIQGGIVKAASEDGAGIGGGYYGYGRNIMIVGGTITATSKHGSGIGGGSLAASSDITDIKILGGSVKANGCWFGIGGGDGEAEVFPVDGTDKKLYLQEIALDGATESTKITLMSYNSHGLTDVRTQDGNKLYFYLPEDTRLTRVVTDAGTYICNKDNTLYTAHAYKPATCMVPAQCECGAETGTTSAHSYDENGICTMCHKDSEGAFCISTVEQLVEFAYAVNAGDKSLNAKLVADVDLSGYDFAAHPWTPIGRTASYHLGNAVITDKGYSGTFDGNGHTIKGLVVKGVEGGIYSYGLFGTLCGTVKNLCMEDFIFELDSATDARVGAVAGQVLEGGTVTNCCTITPQITATNKIAGGIAGCNYGGNISNCYAYIGSGTIVGYGTRHGGVVGDCKDDGGGKIGTVTNCYSDFVQVASTQHAAANIIDCDVKNAEAFASGEVAYLLNGKKTEGTLVWYQQLCGTDKQSIPQFSGCVVGYNTTKYYNVHDWSMAVEGTVIMGTCVNSEKCGGTISLTDPDAEGMLIYNGEIREAETEGAMDGVTPVITYEALTDGVQLNEDGKPVRAGIYRATLTLKDADGNVILDAEGKTVSVSAEYTIFAPVTAALPISCKLQIPEGLNASDLTGKFSYVLTGGEGAPMPESAEVSNPSGTGGNMSFGEITFTKPGEYSYAVKQTIDETVAVGEGKSGFGCERNTLNVTVTISDEGDGVLRATASATVENPLTFNNQFTVSADEQIKESVSVAAVDNELTYGETFAESLSLNKEAAVFVLKSAEYMQVLGTLDWAEGSCVPTVATLTADWKFTSQNEALGLDALVGSVGIQVNKAAAAPLMPESTKTVHYKVDKVSEVELPASWIWQAADSGNALVAGGTVSATAVYNGADAGNYEKESVVIAITRAECTHEDGSELREAKDAECEEDGYTGDRHCLTCNQMLEQGQLIPATGHQDGNSDHVCDNGCPVVQGTCGDADKDHICDYGCGKNYGTCEDADKDHTCDYGCGKNFGTCEDADKDHSCDYGCGKNYGTCEDADKDHTCDYGCGKDFGTCEDADKDHTCDYGCGKNFGTCGDADKDHTCDYGCGKDFGTCEDADKDHTCDYGCGKNFGTCGDADKDHTCDYGCGKDYGTCEDADKDHTCDYGCGKDFGTCEDADKDHTCDYGCGKNFGTCEDADKDHTCDYGCGKGYGTCEDADKDHTCDYGCGKSYGTCEDKDKDHSCDYGCGKNFGTCEDADKDHTCDYGCGKDFGTCEDKDKDHSCDYGCGKSYGTCEDKNLDHTCDYGCGKGYGTCEDKDKDHTCDYGCGKNFGTCEDKNLDHSCDYGCGKSYGTCEDADKDHTCDYGCGKDFGTCEDADKDHTCDYGCGKDFGTCEDKDLNHSCDYGCGKSFGTCEDADKDHSCDYGCGKGYGTCEDKDKDHSCDYGCGKSFGTCEDADKDHTCDYGCGKDYGTCEDADKDHTCDYGCGKDYGTCEDADKDHTCDYGCGKGYGTCEDADKDHSCDYGCGKGYGTCEDKDLNHSCDYGCGKSFGTCEDADKDHSCDYGCGKNFGTCEDVDKDHTCDYGCGKDYGTCEDVDKDHSCDYGCGKNFGTCEDTDKDHTCDYGCGKGYGTCEDADKDHSCDYGCGKYYGTCEDKDLDHGCDYGCGKDYGTCEDADKDHTCDYGCGKNYGTCEDADKDHTCDYGCGKSYGTCEDADKDHSCDYGCGKGYGTCEDKNLDHTCDYGCGKGYGTCEDKNLDHSCDYGCGKSYGTCEDKDLNHSCDYGCGKDYGTCEDKDFNHTCDYCGTELEHSYSAEWKSDESGHWHECSCGARENVTGHTSGGAATETKAEICTVCGYEIAPVTGHVIHTADTGKWITDATNHWHKCIGCQEKMDVGVHNYTDKVTKEPTVDAEGERTYTCGICGNSYTESIAKLKPEESDEDSDEMDSDLPFVNGNTDINGWDAIYAVCEKAVKNDTIIVDMNGTSHVPGKVFDVIKGKDITITLAMGNGISWTINGKTITADKVNDINFAVEVGTTEKPINNIPVEIVNKLAGERKVCNISLAHDGELGLNAILNIQLDPEHAGLFANLFYYNERFKVLQFMGADDIDEYGRAHLVFNHASEYTIIIDKDIIRNNIVSPKTGKENRELIVCLLIFALASVGTGVFVTRRKKKSS